MRGLRSAIVAIVLLVVPLTAEAGPAFEFKPKKPSPSPSSAPKLGPVCNGTRCVIGDLSKNNRPCSAAGADGECYTLGCGAGVCGRVANDNPNLQAGRILSCTGEGSACGKTFCEMGAPGKGYYCRTGDTLPAGAKECTKDSDCYGTKCVAAADGLSISCQEDKNSLSRNCTVGTPEGCMEKRCLRSTSKGFAKVCTWTMPGVFTNNVENPPCDIVGETCPSPSPVASITPR
jgi:hypothetical protein